MNKELKSEWMLLNGLQESALIISPENSPIRRFHIRLSTYRIGQSLAKMIEDTDEMIDTVDKTVATLSDLKMLLK